MKVLIPEKLADPGIELLKQDFEVDVRLGLTPEELLETIGDYDGMIIRSATKVTAEVIDGPRSRVFDQAENRLHAQKALLYLLLG